MTLPRLHHLALVLGLALPCAVVAQGGGGKATITDQPAGTRLSTIIIYTPQMKPLARFYAQALDFPAPTTQLENHIGYWVGANYVGFEPAEEPLRQPGGVSAWFQVNDIHATYERLLKLGARAKSAPQKQPWGDLHATVIDPDGNLLGLIRVAEKSR